MVFLKSKFGFDLIVVIHNLKPQNAHQVYQHLMELELCNYCTVSLRHDSAMESLKKLNELSNTITTTTTATTTTNNNNNNNNICVGASTVVTIDQMLNCYDMGIKFMSSTHSDKELYMKANELSIPFLGGVKNENELQSILNMNKKLIKLYPVQAPSEVKKWINQYKLNDNKDRTIIASGGLHPDIFQDYLDVGIDGFAIGLDANNIKIFLEKANEINKRMYEKFI